MAQGKENLEYYPESLREAIGNYERGLIPGLLRVRQELASEVVKVFNEGDQQKAVEALLEAIELRMLAQSANIRSDLEDLLSDLEEQMRQDREGP